MTDEAASKLPIVTEWASSTEYRNPRNWNTFTKSYHIVACCSIAIASALGISSFSPATTDIAVEFNVSEEAARVAFIIYPLGLAFATVFVPPLTETIGRQWVYRMSSVLFTLFEIGVALVPVSTSSSNGGNFAGLLILRFLAGMAGAPALSIGLATITDILHPQYRLVALSVYSSIIFLAPSLAPVLGAIAIEQHDWRWASWLVAIAGAITLPLIWAMRETYKTKIIKHAVSVARRNSSIVDIDTDRSSSSWREAFAASRLARPIYMIFTEPVVGVWSTYIAFNFALQYAFFAAFPYVYATNYGFDPVQANATFVAFFVGVFFACTTILVSSKRGYQKLMARWLKRGRRSRPAKTGEKPSNDTEAAKSTDSQPSKPPPPEVNLFFAMMGVPCLTIGLFLFGWTAQYSVYWLVPVIGQLLFGAGNLLIFISCVLYLVPTYGARWAASALGANAILRYIGAGIFPLFSVQMFEVLGPAWACTLLGCISLFGAVWVIVLWAHGANMRAKCSFKAAD